MGAQQLIAGRYELGELIGEGGMGAVYRGTDTRSKIPVAIKHLKHEAIAQEPEIVERFKREGEALRKLNHPNIVRVLHIANQAKDYYIIMEYVGGGSLSDLIRTPGQMSVQRVLSIALEVIDALARAHHLKIIHRDIKPGNVLLAADGTPRLTDFGIARMGDRTTMTQANTVLGTLAYLSPEALDGQPQDVRSDLWAFGVLLYEALTGKLPFEESTASATMASIITKPVPSLANMRTDAPPALVSLIERLLAKDPAQRIASARLVGAELEAIMQGAVSTLPPMTQPIDTGSSPLVEQVQQLAGELLRMAKKWENEAKDFDMRADKPTIDRNTASIYRGSSKAYRAAAAELRKLLEDSKDITGVTQAETVTYATVSRKEAARVLERAGMKVKDLYEDKGSIFTAIFPKLPFTSLDERITKLQNAAPSVVILDSGKLSDTGEPYLDFAFNAPP
jgi:hypothetical protein